MQPRTTNVQKRPGKNYDGWWTIEDLAKQVVEKAVPIFECCFSNAQALFAFDNATSHVVFTADALRAKQTNLGHDNKQPQMRPTTYGNGIVQEMCFPPAHPPLLYGEPKGSRSFLRSVVFSVGSDLNARIKNQFVQRWKGLLRTQCYGKSTRLQSPALPVGGVACRTRPLVHFLPKISLRIGLHRELLGSSEATHAGQL